MERTSVTRGTADRNVETALTRTLACVLLVAVLAPAAALHALGPPAAIATGLAMLAVVAAAATGLRSASRRLAEPAPPASGPAIDPAFFERLHNAIFSISDGFILWDAEDRMLVHNGNVGLRHIPAQVPGTRFQDHVTAIYPHIDEMTTGGDPEAWLATRLAWHAEASGSHEMLMKTGRWVMLTERRARDGSTVAIYTDITDRKNAERELQVSERRLAHAQQLAAVGIWEWDTGAGAMYWSPILYQILGIPEDTEPLSLDQYLLIVHPANRDLVRSTFRRLLSTGGQYKQEYQIIRPDGDIRTVRTEAEAITDGGGRIVRVLGAVHDVSDVKSAERNLRRAKEVADHANRAKSEFLANVGHELRTPLNAIIGFSEVLLQEVFGPLGSERYREYAGDIRQSGTHLLGVINDLLDYSKLEAGHLELHVEPVRIGATIEKAVRLLRERADAESVALVADVDDVYPEIEADERKIIQIVLNLVSNAIKFTPEGGTVTVRVTERDAGVEIAVTDSGIGMSADEVTLALAPFGQIDSSMNRRHAGTGLGLPLSRSLAELHGGSLDIESAPGAGTTVRVWLPKPAAAGDGPGDGPAAEPALQLVMGGQAS